MALSQWKLLLTVLGIYFSFLIHWDIYFEYHFSLWESVYYFYVLKLKAISSIMLQSHHSVQFSRSVVSDSLWPHESQHARLPCPSPTPGVYSNSCPSSWWCHPAISSSVIPSSSSANPSQHQGLFQWVNSSHQVAKVLVSASASVLPMNTQDWSPLGWTCWISLQSKGLARVFSNTVVQKHQFFGAQLSSQSNSHIHAWPLEKP